MGRKEKVPLKAPIAMASASQAALTLCHIEIEA
jgi:hypothetical protein